MRLLARLAGLSLALALSLAATGASAADGDMVALFKAMCIDTRGDMAAASQLATRSGWRVVSSEGTLDKGARRYETTVGGRRSMLMLSAGDTPPSGDIDFPAQMKTCTVGTAPETTDVMAELGAYMGEAPISIKAPVKGWAYVERGAGRQYFKDLGPDFINAIKSGPATVIAGARMTNGYDGYLLILTRITVTGP